MRVKVYNQEGKETGTVELPDSVFGVPMNKDLLHQVVRIMGLRKRRMTAHTKDRSEVRGGGKKPWRQKGTGRARHGSSRSPIWRGGGIVFGPRKEKTFNTKLPVKMRKKALAVALAAKARDKELVVLEELKLSGAKTKEAVKIVNAIVYEILKQEKKQKFPTMLFALAENHPDFTRAARNIPNVTTFRAQDLNVVDVLSRKQVILPKKSIAVIEKILS